MAFSVPSEPPSCWMTSMEGRPRCFLMKSLVPRSAGASSSPGRRDPASVGSRLTGPRAPGSVTVWELPASRPS